MNILRPILRLCAFMLVAVFGTNMTFAVPVSATDNTYFQTETTHIAQSADVSFAARAPPMAADNVVLKGGVTVMSGSAFALHGQETVAALFGFSGGLDATNTGPRFVTDAGGNTIDLNFTQGLTSRSPADVNFRAARGGPEYDRLGAPNSYVNFGNGHAAVYGPDGRALYDVSAGRVKVIQWNQNPNTGQWFPRTGSDTKAFEGNVPQSILNDLGLN